ncbi:RNA-directed DNA polymerase, eukaryota, reverse transcriptase zinc-binding domain protein [Tanacetum coccineum]
MGDHRSKEDHVYQISTSIFVTNFPEHFSSRDLWRVCADYGKLIDVYIPNKRSKLGKRYGFVRFINIKEVDRLIKNLCTIWVGRLRLHANVVRFQRPYLNHGRKDTGINVEKRNSQVKFGSSGFSGNSNSYAFAVKQGTLDKKVEETKPVSVALAVEGFENIKINYMGGFWVMIEFQSVTLKEKFKAHVGVGSWFFEIIQASNSFHVDGRVTWVNIEGIPLNVWTKNTFTRIASKWGEFLQEEDQEDVCFHCKRIFIKTTLAENIFESFKIIVKGKVFWVRAIEVSGWAPNFVKKDEEENATDDDNSEEDINEENMELHKKRNLEVATDDEEIPEIVFDQEHPDFSKKEPHSNVQEDAYSDDPFNLYDLLKKKRDDGNGDVQSDNTLKFPTGFTPKDGTHAYSKSSNKSKREAEEGMYKFNGEEVDPDVREKVFTQRSKEETQGSTCSGHFKKVEFTRSGGSILNLMDEVVKVGQTIGYKIEGCIINIEEIIESRGLNEGFDNFVESIWKELIIFEPNAMLRLMKKLKYLKEKIRSWIKVKRDSSKNCKGSLKSKLADIEGVIDKGDANPDVLNQRMYVVKSLQDLDKLESLEVAQKAKIKWSIKGDENSKYYHGILNKKKKSACYSCDVVEAVTYFFQYGSFPKGSNSSFIALIPKMHDAKLVKDFRPISLIGSLYKIIAKILANRMVVVLDDIVNKV